MPEFPGLFNHKRSRSAIDLKTIGVVPGFNNRKQGRSSRPFCQFRVGKTEKEFCFVIGRNRTHLASRLVGPFSYVCREQRAHTADLRVEYPAKGINYVR